jgi:hypothetical protein
MINIRLRRYENKINVNGWSSGATCVRKSRYPVRGDKNSAIRPSNHHFRTNIATNNKQHEKLVRTATKIVTATMETGGRSAH